VACCRSMYSTHVLQPQLAHVKVALLKRGFSVLHVEARVIVGLYVAAWADSLQCCEMQAHCSRVNPFGAMLGHAWLHGQKDAAVLRCCYTGLRLHGNAVVLRCVTTGLCLRYVQCVPCIGMYCESCMVARETIWVGTLQCPLLAMESTCC
jgi:hypothetical protein